MGKTLLELFKGSPQDKAVKADKETLIEQETSGIRVKSAVELNNPGIYGNEATRIVQRSTPDLEKMKKGTGGTEGDGGLIGKGLGKLTGGKVTSIGAARDKVNKTLGIPINQIPTRVVEDIKDQDSQTPVVPGQNGTEVGKLLKESGGNPKTIIRQAGGKLIGKAKDKLRGALFGDVNSLGSNPLVNQDDTEPAVAYTTNLEKETYSAVSNSKKLIKDKKELEGSKLDLTNVSPIYGIKRSSEVKHGESLKATDGSTPETPTPTPETPLAYKYGLRNGSDNINMLSPSDNYTMDENKAFAKLGDETLRDFIPIWFSKVGSSKPTVFRALMSGLTETVSPSWNSSKFVGNPYNFYTFEGIERSTSFNLKLYCNSPVELGVNWEKITKITQMAYPSIGAQFANAPIIKFRIGDIYNNKIGYIESLSYTIPDDSNWETNGKIGYLPKIVDIAITIKFIEQIGSEDRPYGFKISKTAAAAINDKRGANAEIEKQRTEASGNEVVPDEPVKEQTKAGAGVDSVKDKASSALNSAKGKAKNLVDKIKSSTPADVESAKLADNANQSATSDSFDGKTSTEKIKDLESKENLTSVQSTVVASLLLEGYKKYTGSMLKEWKERSNDNGLMMYSKDIGFGQIDIVRIKSNGNVVGPYTTMDR